MIRALLLALLLCPLLAAAEERVLDFHSDLRIAADGELTVTELIRVQVEGRAIRRGIVRDFPTDYRDRTGTRVRVPFSVVRVLRNGRHEPYALERLDNGVRVRIGEANVPLPPGPQLYQLTYRTARQIGFFEAHDELYWNVNGNGWTFRLERLSAEVTLPRDVAAGELKVEAYTGEPGATGRNYEAAAREGGAVFRATRALAPGEGMTIVLSFPKGIVTPPEPAERLRWWLADNGGALAGAAGFALLVFFLLLRWWRVGRDPRAGPPFPRYEPPPGLGAAGVRYVDRMDFDDRCLAAALLGLGARGYLKIRQSGARWALERTGKSLEFLPGEQALAAWLFPVGSDRVTLERTHNRRLQAARDALRAALARDLGKGKLFSRNHGSLIAGGALALVTLAAMVRLEASPPFLIGTLIAMGLALFAFHRWLPAYSPEGRKVQDAIEGLRQYLGVAEKDELARMTAAPAGGEAFARLLPYAFALGVEKTWADRFAASLGAAAVAAAVAEYYVSDAGGGVLGARGAGEFASRLGELGRTISAAAAAPGSRSGRSAGGGSSGRSSGSSGGGGGGGGGSGW